MAIARSSLSGEFLVPLIKAAPKRAKVDAGEEEHSPQTTSRKSAVIVPHDSIRGFKPKAFAVYYAHAAPMSVGSSSEDQADVVEAHAEGVTASKMRVSDLTTTSLSNGVQRIEGKELLGAVSLPGGVGFGVAVTVPAGGVLLMLPANPRFIDGCRVAKMLEMYDQWRIVKLVFEYHPVASAFTAGSLVMGYVNDIADPLTMETGFQAVRDLYTRAGSAMFNVNAGARATLGHPLLKWYYTADQLDPQFEMPGAIVVQTTQPLSSAAGDVTTAYGLVTMSYEIEVRSPSIEGPIPLAFFNDAISLGMQTATGVAGATVNLAWAGVPSQLQRVGAVFWGTIVAADDTGPGSAAWRTWRDSNTDDTIVLGPGNILFMRTMYDGGNNLRMMFAPTLADAMELNSVGAGSAWVSTINQPATVRGFKLWNVNGCDVEGSNE